MRILMCHNRYLIPGGEDMSTAQESALLREAGYEVDLVEYDNAEIARLGRLRTALGTMWSQTAYRHIGGLLAGGRYDVLHVQNFFPLLSPSIIHAAARHGVPVVLSLRNYRLFCANAALFRDGRQCLDCVGLFVPLHGIRHGCYRNSRSASAAVAAMAGLHRMLGTWSNRVHAFVAVSGHVRQRYVQAGFPADRIFVKHNALAADPPAREAPPLDRTVYSGRLSREKGVDVLIRAWRRLDVATELHLIGSGEDEERLKQVAEGDPRIRFRGRLDHATTMAEMAAARLSVLPALWDEPFGRSALESLAVGTPALVSDVGGLPEIVADGGGGEVVPAGSAEALADAVHRWLADPELHGARRREALQKYRSRFSTAASTRRLVEIYRHAGVAPGGSEAAVPLTF